jgi:hypothetical protein
MIIFQYRNKSRDELVRFRVWRVGLLISFTRDKAWKLDHLRLRYYRGHKILWGRFYI